MARIAVFENDLTARESVLPPSWPACDMPASGLGLHVFPLSFADENELYVVPNDSSFYRLDIDAGVLALQVTASVSPLT